jgi:hypothetical protein
MSGRQAAALAVAQVWNIAQMGATIAHIAYMTAEIPGEVPSRLCSSRVSWSRNALLADCFSKKV